MGLLVELIPEKRALQDADGRSAVAAGRRLLCATHHWTVRHLSVRRLGCRGGQIVRWAARFHEPAQEPRARRYRFSAGSEIRPGRRTLGPSAPTAAVSY